MSKLKICKRHSSYLFHIYGEKKWHRQEKKFSAFRRIQTRAMKKMENNFEEKYEKHNGSTLTYLPREII